jgi:hypothetical protein
LIIKRSYEAQGAGVSQILEHVFYYLDACTVRRA